MHVVGWFEKSLNLSWRGRVGGTKQALHISLEDPKKREWCIGWSGVGNKGALEVRI